MHRSTPGTCGGAGGEAGAGACGGGAGGGSGGAGGASGGGGTGGGGATAGDEGDVSGAKADGATCSIARTAPSFPVRKDQYEVHSVPQILVRPSGVGPNSTGIFLCYPNF